MDIKGLFLEPFLFCLPSGYGLPDEVVIEKRNKGDAFVESTGANVKLLNLKFIQRDAIEGILCEFQRKIVLSLSPLSSCLSKSLEGLLLLNGQQYVQQRPDMHFLLRRSFGLYSNTVTGESSYVFLVISLVSCSGMPSLGSL